MIWPTTSEWLAWYCMEQKGPFHVDLRISCMYWKGMEEHMDGLAGGAKSKSKLISDTVLGSGDFLVYITS